MQTYHFHDTYRVWFAILAALGFLGGRDSLEAGVVVIANRSEQTVPFAVRSAGGKPVRYALGPRKLAPVFTSDRIEIVFTAAGKENRRLLEANTIHFFVPAGEDTRLEQLTFSVWRGGCWLHVGRGGSVPKTVVVPVKILVDEEQPAVRKTCEARLRSQLAAVSRVVEQYCRLRFEVVAWGTWESDDGAGNFEQLTKDFKRKAGPAPALLAIGFTSQQVVKAHRAPHSPVDPFATHLLVPDVQKEFSESDQFDVLLHDLGHYLGAVHSPETDSVMFSSSRQVHQAGSRQRIVGFDPINTLAVNLVADEIRTRRVHDLAGLSRSTRQYLHALYSEVGRVLRSDREVVRLAAMMKEPVLERLKYTAAWVDGTRLAAKEVGPWNETNCRPKLSGRDLLDENRPVRWLLNNQVSRAEEPATAVEFVGGDRLPGRVEGFSNGRASPNNRMLPHLLVRPRTGLDWPDGPVRNRVRVTTRWVRRIVWQPVADRYQPGTLFYRDGRQFGFRSLRFEPGAVRLLRKQEILEVPLGDIAELHLPKVDPWEAFFEQLAVLNPDCATRLMRVETASGLQATTSLERFQVQSHGTQQHRYRPENWYHLVQPAWSLEPFWLRHEDIRVRRFFMPHEVPLSRIDPVRSRQQSDLGGVWHPRVDRNVQGGPLESGGREYAWGLGVHAMSELEFVLPSCARSFRTQLGLDHLAGDGGCVEASILLVAGKAKSSGKEKTLFESPLVLGSNDVLKTGVLPVDTGAAETGRLVLRVDPASSSHPRGADPLDIRDIFDWLEPQLGLDPARLREEVFRRAPRMIPAWEGWTVATGNTPGAMLVDRWDETGSAGPAYRLMAGGERGPVTLSGKFDVGPETDQLLLAVSRPADSPSTKIEIRIDGQPAEKFDVSVGSVASQPDPQIVSLATYTGRQVTLELIQQPQDERSLVEWRAITLGTEETEAESGDSE